MKITALVMMRGNIVAKGKVQAVGFRVSIFKIAQKYGLKGFVENQDNGSVIIACEGEKGAIESLIKDVQNIEDYKDANIAVEYAEATNEFGSFNIKMGDPQHEALMSTMAGIEALRDISTKLGSMDTKLGSMDTKLGSMDTKLGSMDTKLGSMDTKLGSMDTKLGSMDTKLGSMDTKLGSMDTTQKKMDAKLDNICDKQEEMKSEQKKSNEKLDIIIKNTENTYKTGRQTVRIPEDQLDELTTVKSDIAKIKEKINMI